MLGHLDALVPSPAAGVPRDLHRAVEQPHRRVVGDERERLAGVDRGRRVAVGVEVDEGGLVDGGGLHEVRLGERIGQGEQPRPLLGEHVDDPPLGPSRMRSGVGDLVEEDEELGVAVLQIADGARGEEALAQVADRALDLSLLLRLSHAAEPGRHAELAREREQLGVEAHGVAVTLEHDDLGIVEEPLPGGAAEVAARAHERAPQRGRAEVEHELGPHRARVGQHHDEDPELARGVLDAQLADVAPVDLGLLADERLDAQEDLALGRRAHELDVPSQRAHAAVVAALHEHVVQAGGAQPRVLRQRLGDEGLVGEQRRGHLDSRHRVGEHGRRTRTLAEAEHALDGLMVLAELRHDGADLPVLGEVEATDLRLLGFVDRHRPRPRRRRCSPRKLPRPERRWPRRGGGSSEKRGCTT